MLRNPVVALALIVAPALAHAQTPDQKAAIDLAITRGQLIYAYDQAAWHGTDDMVAKVPHYENVVGGWIVDGPAASPTIIFYDRDKAEPHAVYIADFQGTRLISSRVIGPGEDNSLSAARKAMIRARASGIDAWAKAKPLFCSNQNPNTVVLPPARPGHPFLVYVLTPQTENNAYPFGGHFRVEIAADGSVGASRGFTNGCLTMPAPKGQNGDPVVITVTHLLDPIPTEIHVFTALTSHMPVAVVTTDKKIWWVTGNQITVQSLK